MRRPWMPLYIADYLADTAHLNATESGAYLHLIMHYWMHGGLPDDKVHLARIAKISPYMSKKILTSVMKFFEPDGRHKRIDAELRRMTEISTKRTTSIKSRHGVGTSEIAQDTSTNDPTMSIQNAGTHTHTHTHKEKKKELRSTNVDLLLKPERFERAPASDWPIDFREQFWAAYPRKVGKKAALAKLERVRRNGEVAFAVLMAEVGRIKRDDTQFIPHPITWLNQGRYLDNAATAASEGPAYLRPPPGCRSLEELRREDENRGTINGGTQIRRNPGIGKARPG